MSQTHTLGTKEGADALMLAGQIADLSDDERRHLLALIAADRGEPDDEPDDAPKAATMPLIVATLDIERAAPAILGRPA